VRGISVGGLYVYAIIPTCSLHSLKCEKRAHFVQRSKFCF